ncbi:MAG TPA: hypothetical protein EYP23_03640, partial [Thermoplasmata archaeon]|nr:hypothetical protein [Thermoplasmata archaeon]
PEDDDEPDCQADPFNSYVNPGDRSFHEDINIPGTDIKLWYNSKDTQGYHLKLRLNTSDQNVGDIGSLFSLSIAGLSFKKLMQQRSSEEKEFSYYWDRKDYHGNISTTSQQGFYSIHRIGINYRMLSNCSGCSFRTVEISANDLFGRDLSGVEGVETFRTLHTVNGSPSTLKRTFQKSYPGVNHENVANGWNFSGIHSSVNELASLKNNSWNVYFRGVMRMPDFISASGKVYEVGHYGCKSYSNDRYAARKFLVDDAKNVYRVCKEGDSQYIKRFGANGTETVEYFIGGGTQTFKDGVTKADEIAFGDDIDFTMDNDGNIIITDTNNHKIYKQYITGQFSLLIGNEGGDTDGKYYEAQLSSPTEPVTDSLGNIYFIDKGNKKIKKASNGEVITLTGQVEGDTHSGDNGLASEATIPMPTQLTVDDNDNLYIAFGANSFYGNTYNERIRMIAPNGYIYPIAGENSSTSPWSNNRSMQAKYATMNYLLKTMSMFVDPQGRLRVGPYIFSQSLNVVFDEEKGVYSYQNGSTLKIFDTAYKHLKTIDTDTNTALYTFTYTPDDKLKTITDRFEQTTEIEYSGDTPTAIISPNGDRLTLEVDEQRNLASVTYPDGESQRFEYDENDLMTKMTQPNGNSFTHEYDEHGRIVNFLDEEGGKWTYGFTQDDASRSHTITKTSASGNTRVKTYTTSTNSTKNMNQTDADGTVSTSSSDGTTSTSQSCGIQTTRVPYGSGGATGSTTSTSYLNETSGSFTFNACSLTFTQKSYFDDNSTKVKTSLTKLMKGSNSSYCRYPNNYYAAQYFNTTAINTNYENSTTTITTPQNRILTSTFDPITELTTKVESAGTLPVTYTYDNKGKVTSITQGDRSTEYLYNDKEELSTLVDADGVPTQYSYDAMHRVTSIQKAGQKVEYTYDANGNLASTITPNQATFQETSNKINYPSTFKSPLGFTKSYTYTTDRELESITLPSGKQITYTYNKTNLNQQSTSETTTSYTYECGGLLTNTSTDTGEGISYNYDGLRRVTDIIYSGVLNETISYGNYNTLLDLPQALSYAGTSTTLTYDKDGLLTKSGDYTLNREADTGRVTSIVEGNYKQEFTYNDYGELESKEDSYQNNRLYRYDILQRTASGKIETKVEQGISNKPTVYAYTYDQSGRLTQVKTDGTTTEEYLYDHNGNRLEAIVNNITTKASYTLEDQLEVYGQNTYRYDDDGYLQEKVTPDGTTAYEYGTLGELRKVVTPTKTIEYIHNANNQRVAKKVNGETVEKYLWADLTTLLAIYDSNDTL